MAIWLVISFAVALSFALIARCLAGRRKRHVLGWSVAAAIFPPVLLVLMVLPKRDAAEG